MLRFIDTQNQISMLLSIYVYMKTN